MLFPADALFITLDQKKMTSNPARLRWLIRLHDDEEEGGSKSTTATDEDLLAALHSLPSWPADGEEGEEEEKGGPVNAGGRGNDPRRALSRPLLLPKRRPLDRRRALASCLAQHVVVCAGLGCGWEESPGISRTVKGGKPFARRRRATAGAGGGGEEREAPAPNFNFNVSHDGPWLALAAEPLLLVGVDVSSPRVIGRGAGGNEGGKSSSSEPPPALGADRLRCSLGSALSDSEWLRVASQPDAASQDALFRSLWALREAWSKARGDGLGAADLARAEFSIGGGKGEGEGGGEEEEEEGIALRLDGILQEQWYFELHDLPDGSALAVALGPPSAAVDAGGTFIKTLGRVSMTAAEVKEARKECLLNRKATRNDTTSWRRMSVRELLEEAKKRRRGGGKSEPGKETG